VRRAGNPSAGVVVCPSRPEQALDQAEGSEVVNVQLALRSGNGIAIEGPGGTDARA